jgi:predicted nucleic acid-binding protein
VLIGTTSGWPRQTAGLTVMANVLPWCAHEGDLASPVPVIAETSWLLLDRLGHSSHLGFLRMVTAGRLRALDLEDEEWRRCSELVERYQDLRLDLMDVSLVAPSERLGENTTATLDRRDFAVVRPRHLAASELLR